MRLMVMAMVLGCGGPAKAGDLWMTIEQRDGAEDLRIHLPADWVALADEPLEIDTVSGEVDLRAEARRLDNQRVGSVKTWKLDNDGDPMTLELSHIANQGPAADKMGLAALGPLGNGLTMTFELHPTALDAANKKLDAVIDIDGLELTLNERVCEQLRRSPPVVLVEAKGPKGGSFRIDTR